MNEQGLTFPRPSMVHKRTFCRQKSEITSSHDGPSAAAPRGPSWSCFDPVDTPALGIAFYKLLVPPPMLPQTPLDAAYSGLPGVLER